MIILLITALILWLLYFYGTLGYNYWQKKGVKHAKSYPFIGTCWRLWAQKVCIASYAEELYKQYPDEKIVGCYLGSRKSLLLRDPEIIKHVMVSDFDKFYSRGIHISMDIAEPILKNVFFADGDMWKLLRQRQTPAFTSGKLKAMFPLIVERAQRLQNVARAAAEKNMEQDVRDLMARFTTDFIGACGFGIDTDSMNDDSSKFRRLGQIIFTYSVKDGIVKALKFIAPYVFKDFHIISSEIEPTTVALVKGIMEQRNYQSSGRNDFIDLLMELKQKGKIIGESIEKKKADGTPETAELELDDLMMAAQVFVFFAAGFETSSSATSYTLLQLAFHPEAQQKCQQEIDEVLSRYDNKLCYDAVTEMKYLKMCFFEGLRIFPSLGYISRRCEAPYTFPGTNVTIDPKVWCLIPVLAIHNDPNYWEDPEKFIPERFHPDNMKNIQSCTYMPFGNGPRQCIGERLGLMQSLAGLAALLGHFSFTPSKNSLRKPIIDPSSGVTLSVKGGVPLNVTLRQKD